MPLRAPGLNGWARATAGSRMKRTKRKRNISSLPSEDDDTRRLRLPMLEDPHEVHARRKPAGGRKLDDTRCADRARRENAAPHVEERQVRRDVFRQVDAEAD